MDGKVVVTAMTRSMDTVIVKIHDPAMQYCSRGE